MLSCFDNHPTIVDGVITGIDRNLMNDGKHHAHRNKTALNQAKGHAMCDSLASMEFVPCCDGRQTWQVMGRAFTEMNHAPASAAQAMGREGEPHVLSHDVS